MRDHFDLGCVSVIFITFLLFAIALFTKETTQDLLLEAGVFLISVKLIMMGYKNSVNGKKMERELTEIKALLTQSHRSRETASLPDSKIRAELVPIHE